MAEKLTNPAVAAFVAALNAGDRDAFYATLADGATMSDDGTERDLRPWVEKEAFTADGRMDVEDVSADGLRLTATFTNSTWGAMRTRWSFSVTGGKVARFETGQA